MYRFLFVVSLLVSFGLVGNELRAQESAPDPLEAAVRTLLTEHRLLEIGEALVLASGRATSRNTPKAETKERLVHLAASLGARTGSMDTLIHCQPGPPPAEMFRRGWCRMPEGILAVIQVGEPKRTDQGWEVPITRYGITRLPPDTYSIWAEARTFGMTRAQDGSWATGWTGYVEHAHWP
jgi:hypothetical protein